MIHRSLPVFFSLFCVLPLAASPANQTTLLSFVKPTDVVKVNTTSASFPELTAESTPSGEVLRRFTFTAAKHPSLRLSPQKSDWDWSQQGAMSLRLQNAMDWALTLNVRIESRDGKVLSSRIALPAGPAQTLLVPLVATTPLARGMRSGPPMPITLQGRRLLLAETVSGELTLEHVSAVILSLDNPDSPQSILLGRFGVSKDDQQAQAYAGLIDAWGQYAHGKWPGKIEQDLQLREAVKTEREQLNAWLEQRPEQDKFGGWMGGASFSATGFFRTEKRDGRWYLVSPQGNPFYSLGVNAVSAWQSPT